MIQKRIPVYGKISYVVRIYVYAVIVRFIVELFLTDSPLFTLNALKDAYQDGIQPYVHGFGMLLVIWGLLAYDWRKEGEQRMRERLAYKESLPELERHLYEIEEYGAKLPEGPMRKKKRFGFLNRKNISFGLKDSC